VKIAGKPDPPERKIRQSFGQGWRLCVACILVLTAGQYCHSQEFTVRLLDFRSGHGIKNHSIWLQAYDENGALIKIEQRTDREGIAVFRPSGKLRGKVAVSATDVWCVGQTEVTTAQLQTGVVEVTIGKAQKKFHVPSLRPGEIILPCRPVPLWAKILAPLERE